MAKAKRIIELDRPDCDVRGPTLERLERANDGAALGGEDRGTRVFHMLDSPLDRLYARLVRSAKSENKIDRLRVEYAALARYHRLFVESGMIGSVGSVDPNRTYSPSPFNRTFLATSERQFDDRQDYHRAKTCLGHVPGIVVDNVVCHGNSLEQAGHCVGKDSPGWAHAYAQKTLREGGYRLAIMWGMARIN